jgi:hypothetical protein
MRIRVPDTLTADNSEKYEVSIRLWPDGLSFSGYIPHVPDSFFSEKVLFDDDVNLAQSLKNIFFDNPSFSFMYKSLYVICVSEKYTLVPDNVYTEKGKDLLFSFCHQKRETGRVLIQQVEDLQSTLLFEVDNEAYEFMMRSLVMPRFIHYLSPLMLSWQKNSFSHFPKQIYSYIHDGILDIVCFEHGDMLFANSFSFEKDNDIIYFIMYTCRQLGVNQVDDSLYFCGDDTMCNSVMSVIKEYISHADYMPSLNTDVYFDVKTLTGCVL